jgi:hypothetical protein
MASTKQYCVYWIRDPHGHTNPFNSGYIGISANYAYRMKRYQQRGQKSHLLEKFQNGAESVILFSGLDESSALVIEKELRPRRNIGWNKNSGGFMPLGG